MKLADEICYYLMSWVANNGDIVIPNYYVGSWEMDLFRLTGSGILIEYEIKITKADFKNDFKKTKGLNKHDEMLFGKSDCNRFFFVMPPDIVQVSDIPSYAGYIVYKNKWFRIVKNAPMLHREKKFHSVEKYKELASSLAFREQIHRGKARYYKYQYETALQSKIEQEL